MPLIDVIFLLLTFFIYAMVMMIPAELMPMQLQTFAAATPARPKPAVTISIMLDGKLFFNREPVNLDSLVPAIRAAKADDAETKIYLALEAGEGTIDRAPLLTELWDRLQFEGLDVHFVGRPKEAGATASVGGP